MMFLVMLPIGPIADAVIYGVRNVEWLGTSGDLLATLSRATNWRSFRLTAAGRA